MKKKHILAATLIGAMGLVFSSCSDYLSVERYFGDRQNEERIFKSRDYTEQWLAQAYLYLTGENMDIAEKDHCLTNFADDMYYGDRGEEYREFIHGEYNESRFQGSWLQSYAGIRQASILIDNVDINEDYTPEEIKDVKAQARFLRAYMYWLLLRKSTITHHTMIFHYQEIPMTNAWTLSPKKCCWQRRTSLTNVISSTSDVLPRERLWLFAQKHTCMPPAP